MLCRLPERGDEELTFDEFLDIFSVFSARATKEEKIKVAFRMYGNRSNLVRVKRSVYQMLWPFLSTAADKEGA